MEFPIKHANATGLSEDDFIGNHTQRQHLSNKTKLATSWTHAGWGKVWANPTSNTTARLRPQNTHTHTHTHTDTQTHRHTDTQTHRHTDTDTITDTQTKGQCSIVNGQLPMAFHNWAIANCQWSMVSGESSTTNGQRQIINGHWPRVTGQSLMVNC